MNDTKLQEGSKFNRRASNDERRIDEIMNDDEVEKAFGLRDDNGSIEREGVLYPVGGKASSGSGNITWNRDLVHS